MPATDGTLTVDDVAAFLGVPVDERMTEATDAARAWAINRRCNTDAGDLFRAADVHFGAVLFAGLTYQARSAPTGIPGYEAFGGASAATQEALWRARELVGLDPVTA